MPHRISASCIQWPVTIAVASALLGACGGSHPVDRAALAANAANLTPADARLADLYLHACKSCHVIAASGAPLSGDQEAWQARMKKGLPALVTSAIAGLNGMPAGGQCVRCTAADYEQLIRFMAGESP
jgi:cytochrome c5